MLAPSRARDITEVEFKLEVVGNRPAETLAAVERLDHLVGYRLGPPSRHRIRDRYWDTPGWTLRAGRTKLRLREVDGVPLFTVKRDRRTSGGLFACREVEVPATSDGWRAVVDTLACLGIALPEPEADAPEPAERLAAAGLGVIQDRTTERVVRSIRCREGSVAELALDATRYDFGDRIAECHELEVEQLGGADDAVRALGEALLARFPGRLLPAKKGKFGRGMAFGRN